MKKMMVCRVEYEFPSLELGRTTFIPYYQTYFIVLFLQHKTRGSKSTVIKRGPTTKQSADWWELNVVKRHIRNDSIAEWWTFSLVHI